MSRNLLTVFLDLDGFMGNGVTGLESALADFGSHELLLTPF